MVKLTVKIFSKEISVVPEVTLAGATVDIPGMVSGARGLPAIAVLKVVVVSAVVAPDAVAAK